ncbi:MAG: transporter, major facilitator family protein [Candidatus Angelobacter sp.]|nr:transporter, major facilitator family protein [Candidatus Angelobacter sp.]
MEQKSVRNLAIIYVAAWMRSFGIGLLGVVLGVFLYREGFSSTAIGLVIAAGLAGAAVGTVFITFTADRLGRRRTLFALSLLTSVGALPLIFHFSVPAMVLIAFLGMLNGMGTDRSPAFALEQATIPGLVPDIKRTWALAWYSVVLDASGAVGALAAGIPIVAQKWWNVELAHSYRLLFIGYAAISVLTALLYLLLSPEVEIRKAGLPLERRTAISPETKSTIKRLCALFAIDAFGGGFLTDALVSYWFFRRFGIAESQLAVLFFTVHVLNALSHLGAAWLARRIGLIKTMVFTHLPSSIFLIAAAFMPSPRWAVLLFLLRESLVEMDVPTRQSYVAAVVKPEERTFAAGVTNLVRNSAWAAASAVAGIFMQQVAFAAPLLLGGSLKIIYDGLLWRAFRHLAAPEERKAQGSS